MNNKERRQFGSLEMKAIAYLQLRGTKTLSTGDLKDVLGIAEQTDKD